MADDSQEVADIIDGLGDSPAPLEVYNATRDYDTRYLASAGAAAAAAGGGGGSQPAALQSKDALFTEEATAGTYTASVDLPAGATLFDIELVVVAAWAADTVLLDAGDNAGSKKLADGFDVGYYVGGPYDPVTAAGYATVVTATGWALYDTYITSKVGSPTQIFGGPIYYPTAQTITLVVTTTIGSPPVTPTGELLAKVTYMPSPVAVDAVFA
jgi:hypothetical protein